MPVPPPKNPGGPIFYVDMPHARSGGDALRKHGLSENDLNLHLQLREKETCEDENDM